MNAPLKVIPRKIAERPRLGLIIKWLILLSAIVLTVVTLLEVEKYPRTDDASVTANVVSVAPRVTGRIVQVAVTDDQFVKAGDLLFAVDATPYRDAVEKAAAQLEQSQDTLKREEPLLPKGFATQEQVDEARTSVRIAGAELSSARYDLESCRVVAPVDGYTSNVNLSVGNFAHAADPVIIMVDASNWYVIANFRESALHRIQVGTKATVYLMTRRDRPYQGKVVGIGRAVVPEEAPQSTGVPNVQRELNWVRLAQRFPVRIRLETTPADLALRVGTSAIVTISGNGSRN
jgi:multidrug efflux system membrane fusion protein